MSKRITDFISDFTTTLSHIDKFWTNILFSPKHYSEIKGFYAFTEQYGGNVI